MKEVRGCMFTCRDDAVRRKIIDDIIDIMNYAAFLYVRLGGGEKLEDAFYTASDVYMRRMEEYRDAWRDMSLDELAAGLRLKAGRIGAMLRRLET